MVKRKWLTLLVTTSSTALVFLDNTAMPVALPTIQHELLFSDIGLVWVVNSYLLCLTALLLIGGRLCDLFGMRSVFLWGLSLFGIGSLLCGLAPSCELLLLGRAVQGAGGAFTIPTTGALLAASFPEGERAKAMGLNTGISSIFLVLGPTVGGIFTEWLGWRTIFYINIPIVLFGMAMALYLLRAQERKREPFHVMGAFAAMLATITLVVGLMQANVWGWGSIKTLSLLLASPLCALYFLYTSQRHSHPILDFTLFKNPVFTTANLSIFIAHMIVMATVLWAIYFQEVVGYSPLQTGLLIFVAVAPVFVVAPAAGLFSDRFGARLPLLTGFFLLSLSILWLTVTISWGGLWLLLPGLFGFGCAIPMVLSPTFVLAIESSKSERLGAVSAISTKTSQLASTVGMALMTAVYYGVTDSNAAGFIAISLLAVVLALAGWLLVFFNVKKKLTSEAV